MNTGISTAGPLRAATDRKGLAAGLGAIALGVGFNAPFAVLAWIYDYPQVLRRPASEALELFAAGGSTLVVAWYAFMLSALALVPLAISLSITPRRLAEQPALAIGAAVSGALAGLTQAIGLSRWVFVVPSLTQGDSESAQQAFAVLNAWGGVAIGEHLGQLLTASFVAQLAWLQWREGREATGAIGLTTALLLIIGTGEGLALALGQPGETFALFAIAGFAGLTLWLLTTGAGLIRGRAA